MKIRSAPASIEGLERRQLFSTVLAPAHVVIVIEENQSYGEIIGNSTAPYINSLASGGALFTNAHAVDHPSQPNYLALFSGSTQGSTDDDGPLSFNAPNLGSQLIAKGLSFGGYSEDLPSVGSQVLTSGGYARKHNPWSDFTNVPAADNMPFTSFPSDYSKLPTVSIVVPNLDNDMHDGTVAQGDAWLQQNLGAYAAWAKSNDSLLIYTMDEDDGSDPSNQIATFFYGAHVVPGKYSENITHYNVLRTIEDMYGLGTIANSTTAADIADVWRAGAVVTGTANVDQITLMQDPDHLHVDWLLNGTKGAGIAINDSAGLTLNGNGGGDVITLNYSNGIPLPNKLNLNGTFTLNNLATTGNPLANTTIDLGASALYVSYTTPAADPVNLIRGYVQAGYNNGLWTGTSASGVIRSSIAAADATRLTTIGYVDSADNLITGQPANTVELAYTIYGDTGLQGTVSFTDFMRMTQHYSTTGNNWSDGDFNYDGTVNAADFALLSKNYGSTMAAVPAPVASTLGSNPAPTATSSDTTHAKKPTRQSKWKSNDILHKR